VDPVTLSMLMSFLPTMLGGLGSGSAGGGSTGGIQSFLAGLIPTGAPSGSGAAGGGSMLSSLIAAAGGSAAPGGGGPMGVFAALPLVSSIVSIISGPGAGQTRRAAARSAVMQNPSLQALHNAVLSAVPVGGSGPSSALLSLLKNPTYRSALLPWVQEADRLGGMGVLQGPRANYIGDIVKWVTTGETSKPKRYLPTLAELNQALGIASPAIGTPSGYASALPLQISSPFSAPSAAPRPSYWASTAYRPGGF
jgi:hypothetical protein